MVNVANLRVRGSYYYGVDDIETDILKEGKKVSLCPEPENKYDKFAVLVQLSPGAITLGHIAKEYSRKFFKLAVDKCIIDSYISRIILNKMGSKQVYINVSYEETSNVAKILKEISTVGDNICGVYCIHCVASGFYYIGSSRNIKERVRKHIQLLESDNHHNNVLQSNFNQYGYSQFKINILNEVDQYENLLLHEKQKIFEFLQMGRNLYNKTIDGVGVINKDGAQSFRTISDFTSTFPETNSCSKGNDHFYENPGFCLTMDIRQSELDRIYDSKVFHDASEGCCESQIELGVTLFERCFFDEAFVWFLKSAQSGNADAYNKIGYMYYHGKLGKTDYVKAAEYWEIAAEMGSEKARSNLITISAKTDSKIANAWVERSNVAEKPLDPVADGVRVGGAALGQLRQGWGAAINRISAAETTAEENINCNDEFHSYTDPSPEQILAARQALGKTQHAMAKILGVTHATYCRWENGHITPIPDMRRQLWKLIDLAKRQRG